MPLGGLLRRCQLLKQQGELPPDLSRDRPAPAAAPARARPRLFMTFINVAIMGTAATRPSSYMDSVQFCGQTCHSVMQPEYTAYLTRPHSRVACVDCHIGPGAPWFVRAKISGRAAALRRRLQDLLPADPLAGPQPAAVARHVRALPLAREFTGDKLLVRTKYADDEQNTPSTTVLLVKIGGRTTQGLVGIHGRHLAAAERIEYVSTDGRRQVIPRVTYTTTTARRSSTSPTDVEGDAGRAGARRAPEDGLHGLPQPADARLPDARTRRGRGHDRRPHRPAAAVRQEARRSRR